MTTPAFITSLRETDQVLRGGFVIRLISCRTSWCRYHRRNLRFGNPSSSKLKQGPQNSLTWLSGLRQKQVFTWLHSRTYLFTCRSSGTYLGYLELFSSSVACTSYENCICMDSEITFHSSTPIVPIMWQSLEIWELRTKFWSENLRERDHLEDISVDGRVILEWFSGK